MTPFPVDRAHPPRSIHYAGAPSALTIRPWTFDDLDAHIELLHASLAELRAFMPFSHYPMTIDSQYQVIKRFQASYWDGHEYVCGIFGADGRALGGIGLHPRTPLNPSALEVGYWCGTPYAGRGQTTAAVRCMIAFAFDCLGCDRVQLMHDTANTASKRVAEKCGFRAEGIVRKAIAPVPQQFRDQGYRGEDDGALYGICLADLSSLSWLSDVRAALSVVDALGQTRPWRHSA